MKRTYFAPTAALLLALAACDSPTSSRLEGTDGFGDNTLDVYSVVADAGNGWAIANGELTGTGPVTNSLLLWNSLEITDGWVEAESLRADDGGLVMKMIDINNYLMLAFRDDGAPGALGAQNLALIRRSGGVYSTLLTKDVAWPRGSRHTVRLETAGTKLIVYFDGASVGEVPDAATPGIAGRVGMRHNGTDATWISTFDIFRWHVPVNF